jgi:hypothetical protein
MTRGQTADSQMKSHPIAEGGIDNGAGLAMIGPMPRDGAIIFSDLIGKSLIVIGNAHDRQKAKFAK